MCNLIIDGKDMGQTIGWRKNEQLKRWVFLMSDGYYIGVDFSNIKRFTSSPNAEIITYQGSGYTA